MINKDILSKIFKSKIIDYSNSGNKENEFISIRKKKLIIYILPNTLFMERKKFFPQKMERKNCDIEKANRRIYILFHKDFIKSIIRKKILNTLLNN